MVCLSSIYVCKIFVSIKYVMNDHNNEKTQNIHFHYCKVSFRVKCWRTSREPLRNLFFKEITRMESEMDAQKLSFLQDWNPATTKYPKNRSHCKIIFLHWHTVNFRRKSRQVLNSHIFKRNDLHGVCTQNLWYDTESSALDVQ